MFRRAHEFTTRHNYYYLLHIKIITEGGSGKEEKEEDIAQRAFQPTNQPTNQPINQSINQSFS